MDSCTDSLIRSLMVLVVITRTVSCCVASSEALIVFERLRMDAPMSSLPSLPTTAVRRPEALVVTCRPDALVVTGLDDADAQLSRMTGVRK